VVLIQLVITRSLLYTLIKYILLFLYSLLIITKLNFIMQLHAETSFNGESENTFHLVDSTSSNSDICQFDIDFDSLPLSKRLKTRCLNFLSHNYLYVIKVLVLVIALLLISMITSVIYNSMQTISNGTVTSKPDVARTTLMGYSERFGIETSISPDIETSVQLDYLSSSSQRLTTLVEGVHPTYNMSLERIACTKVNCRTLDSYQKSCYIHDTDYRSVRAYTCCGCLPPGYIFKRYVKDRFLNTVLLVVEVKDVKPERLSSLDLKIMPHLQHLRGRWTVVEESDTATYMAFIVSGFDQPPLAD